MRFSVAIYALRAKAAHSPDHHVTNGILRYWQLSYAGGYISILSDLCSIMRTLLIQTTRATPPKTVVISSEGTSITGLLVDSSAEGTAAYRYSPPEAEHPDLPEARKKFRDICGLLSLSALAPVVTGVIAGVKYTDVFDDASAASLVQALRCVTPFISGHRTHLYMLFFIIQVCNSGDCIRAVALHTRPSHMGLPPRATN